jgi:energy-coupling factor transporter ATP-binding protein EcfA2
MRLRWSRYRVQREGRTLLDLPDLTVEGPGLVLLLGATGSGKSTLLRSATGLSPAGGARVDGRLHRGEPPPRTAFLPQDAIDGLLSFDAENEFLLRLRALGAPAREARVEASHRLEEAGLADRARVPFDRLSAGERRRIALAALLVQDPQVLLLDEPTNHLDATWRERLLDEIRLHARTRLVLAAMHDAAPLLPAAHRILVLRDGQVAYDGAPAGLESAAWPELRLGPPRRVPLPSPNPGILVRLHDVHAERDQRPVLQGVHAQWGPGLHVIEGDNGSGKTTLLRLLVGLERPRQGTVLVAGEDPNRLGPAAASRNASLHFEEPTVAFFARSVHDEVAFGPRNHAPNGCDVRAQVREALFDFGLDHLYDRHPLTLSGGERERVALACDQAANAPVILLDEPTLGLDAHGRQLLEAFLARQARHRCILVATHDPALAAQAHTRRRLVRGRLEPTEVTASTP